MEHTDIPHIPGSRPLTYFGIKAENADLLQIAGLAKPPLRERLGEGLRRLHCKVFGHKMIRQKWMSKDGTGDWEWHIGCTRCPEFRTEPGEEDGQGHPDQRHPA